MTISQSDRCEHGFMVIDGWHYSSVGGMIFPTNKRCEMSESDDFEIEGFRDEIKRLRERLAELRFALDWIADPRGNDICTPKEIAEDALQKDAALKEKP